MDGAWFIADCPEISGKSAGRDQSKKPVGVWWRPPNSFLWTSARTVSVESCESRFVRRSLLNEDSLVTGIPRRAALLPQRVPRRSAAMA